MRIEPLLAGKIRDFCRTAGATPYMLLLAAFKVLLVRYTDIEDVLVGSGTSNRQAQEVAPLVGFFVNTLVMRTDLSGNPTFGEMLSKVKETAASTRINRCPLICSWRNCSLYAGLATARWCRSCSPFRICR
jgi:non-ribosomal peptide synthetase component F